MLKPFLIFPGLLAAGVFALPPQAPQVAAPAAELCAGHAQQFGGESPLPNLMEVKG
jgi:hypothetical protein